MPLSPSAVVDIANEYFGRYVSELTGLDDVRRYWKGRQALPSVIPASVPTEVKEMAWMSRVNVIALVVESLSQSISVVGFRGQSEGDNADVWSVWQANRLDAKEAGIHEAALAYGASYAVVLPGQPVPVIRPVSPRRLLARYSYDNDDWPVGALESVSPSEWRLYDDAAVYILSRKNDRFEFVEQRLHGLGVVPVVRFRESIDLDADNEPSDFGPWRPSRGPGSRLVAGQVAPLMPLQDQIDLITFNLLVAQHYSAFRQRYIVGWVPDDEAQKAKAAASQLWTFDSEPDKIKLGEFTETNLDGYIRSREASLRHAASISQTPAHELIGEMVNLSAEALAAAEAGRDRKVSHRQTVFGEAWEQVLQLAGSIAGISVPDDAQVVWKDTSARSFAATTDALGKASTMLGVPPQELWERIPGATQQDVQRWRAAADAESGDDSKLAEKANALGILIRAGVSPEAAAEQVGLDLTFTGAVPVTLRLPASQAAGLESTTGSSTGGQ